MDLDKIYELEDQIAETRGQIYAYLADIVRKYGKDNVFKLKNKIKCTATSLTNNIESIAIRDYYVVLITEDSVERYLAEIDTDELLYFTMSFLETEIRDLEK